MKGPISSRKAKTREAQKRSGKPGWHSFRPYAVVLCALLVTGLAVVWRFRLIPQPIPQPPSVAENPGAGTANAATATAGVQPEEPREVDAEHEVRFTQHGNLAVMWDRMKPHMRQPLKPTSTNSNIMPQDYAGPEACMNCHRENYADWSQHPHRWMNAVANDETVRGDFSGQATIHYLGGVGTFFRKGSELRMRFERDDLQREYRITQTIGSRFYQYYVGVGLVGPEPETHAYYHEEFVLPFGYWLERQVWVPIVHVFDELAEGKRWESVEELKPPVLYAESGDVGRSRGIDRHAKELDMIYAKSCNFCHTTFSLGDLMIRNPKRIGQSLTEGTLLEMHEYVAAVHPELWSGSQAPELLSSTALQALIDTYESFDAREHAVTLGVSCEACHLGCRQHAEDEASKPAFTGQSPNLYVFRDSSNDTSRTPANINAACARCHTGKRPTYAGGMSTWNSTEHTDAIRGSCYTELSCVHCHDPHKPIGKTWRHTPEQDDASCLACHPQYEQAELRFAHTRHPAGSPGDRCMNCHMPKINEGMQDVVRTHTIFSPTQPDMIEANHPNACNLCHLNESIEWTLAYLKKWYDRSFNEGLISRSYADREEPVGLGWLKQSHEPTRLVAVEAFGRQQATWGLASILELLDDPYLMNRQFAQTAVESLTGSQLDQRFGYWYYLTRAQREPLLNKIRAELIGQSRADAVP